LYWTSATDEELRENIRNANARDQPWPDVYINVLRHLKRRVVMGRWVKLSIRRFDINIY